MQARQSTILIAIALIAGAAIGFAGSTFSYRHRWLRPPGERPFDRMSRSLGLSDAQRGQMLAVLEETRSAMDHARLDYDATRRKLMVVAYLRSRALLSPEQQRKFDRKFVPKELLREAQQRARPGANASSAPVAGAAPTATATPVPTPAVTSPSGA